MAKPVVNALSSLAAGLRHGVIRGLAVVAMLGVFALSNLGTVGTYVLGVAGITGVTLGTTATPANAWWRGRRVVRRRWRRRWW